MSQPHDDNRAEGQPHMHDIQDRHNWPLSSDLPQRGVTFIRALTELGFPFDEARRSTYLLDNPATQLQDAIQTACDFRAAGISASRGQQWFWSDVPNAPESVLEYEGAGWGPGDIFALRHDLHAAKALAGQPDSNYKHWVRTPEEEEWRATGIPFPYIRLYVLAGHTPTGAQDLDARRNAGDTTIEATITTLAALRGAHPTAISKLLESAHQTVTASPPVTPASQSPSPSPSPPVSQEEM